MLNVQCRCMLTLSTCRCHVLKETFKNILLLMQVSRFDIKLLRALSKPRVTIVKAILDAYSCIYHVSIMPLCYHVGNHRILNDIKCHDRAWYTWWIAVGAPLSCYNQWHLFYICFFTHKLWSGLLYCLLKAKSCRLVSLNRRYCIWLIHHSQYMYFTLFYDI